jgi:CSLREA domain-containing protein
VPPTQPAAMTYGTRTFTATLNTYGNQTISVTQFGISSITGTSNTIIVQPAGSSLVVTRTDDRNQNCSIGDCSLREAIVAANALPSDDTITFDPNVFAAPQIITMTSPIGGMQVENNGKLTINGAGKVTLTGFVGQRAIYVDPSSNLTLNNFTIDGIFGGGIENFQGTLTLNNSTISNNVSTSNGIGIGNYFGVLVINNSTISGNTGTTGTNPNNGAGIYNSGTATIKNSTIAFNDTFASSPPQFGNGGGIYNDPGFGGTVTIANTIIANNRGNGTDNLYGAFISQGYNLIGYSGTNATITGDLTGNIMQDFTPLAPLADNGGGVKTHALPPDSPAIDKGKSFGATTDQRGFTRPYDEPTISNAAGGDGSDIGAIEMLSAPAAANVTISGKVMTSAGQGLVNAIVTLTDQQGNSRSARTSSFGYFSFADVAAGETVVITITSKRYTFAPQVVTVYEAISDLNFVADET